MYIVARAGLCILMENTFTTHGRDRKPTWREFSKQTSKRSPPHTFAVYSKRIFLNLPRSSPRAREKLSEFSLSGTMPKSLLPHHPAGVFVGMPSTREIH